MKRLFKYVSFALVALLCAGVFVACDKEQTDLMSNMVNLEFTSVVYDGTEKKPTVEVKVGETVIDSDEYEIEYKNNTNVGTASVKISANEKSDLIKGTVTVGFEIVKASKEVATLADINSVMQNSNYESVVIGSEFTLSAAETLKVAEGFTVNFGDNLLVNNGTIENKGTIIANNGIVNNGTIENEGEIKAVVDTFAELQGAVGYATKVVVNADIPAGQTPNENKLKISDRMAYEEIEIDLNGHTLCRQVRFEAGYGSKTIKVTNSSEKEAVISTAGLDLTAVILIGNAKDSFVDFNAKLSNVKVIGDESNDWAPISSNGNYKDSHYFNFVATNCEFAGGNTAAAYLPAYYNYKFVDCSFSGKTAYYTKSGSHTLNNCSFSANAESYTAPIYNGNGCYETGSALILDSAQNYPEPLIVKVNGGKFESRSGYAIEEFATAVTEAGVNFYSTLQIKGAPTYSYASGKEAVCVPKFIETSDLDVESVVNNLYEKVYNNTQKLGTKTTYTYEELLTAMQEDIVYYIELGTIVNVPDVYKLTIGETVFTKGQKVKVSIGNSNYIEDYAFYLSEGKIYVSATALMFEGMNDSTIKINGKEFRVSLYSVNFVGVTGVKYNGEGNVATAVPEKINEYNLEVATGKHYLEISYTGASEDDIIVTRKDNDGVLSYGITGSDGSADNIFLGLYPVGYHKNPADIPELYDGLTLNYTFYVVGRGISTIKFNINLK